MLTFYFVSFKIMENQLKGEYMKDEELITIKEAADHLKVKPGFLYKMTSSASGPPAIPFIRLGEGQGAIRFRKSVLDKYLQDKTIS